MSKELRSFTIEITNCGSCPYSSEYTDGYLHCEYSEELDWCLGISEFESKEGNIPIPEDCPVFLENERKLND
jgi:hypothetical protein